MANKVFFVPISRRFRGYFFFYLFEIPEKMFDGISEGRSRLPGSVRSGDVKSSATVDNVILKIWEKRQNGWSECHEKEERGLGGGKRALRDVGSATDDIRRPEMECGQRREARLYVCTAIHA